MTRETRPVHGRTRKIVLGWTLVLGLAVVRNARAEGESGGRFMGQTRCGNPTCHGAGLPTGKEPTKVPPWKYARTQWNTSSIDRHSRAYRTLQTEASKTIAHYMGIEATTSEKCLVCHATAAATVEATGHRQSDGVTCEHCHGPAEHWLKVHVERDWKQKRAQYVSRGFYDNNDFVLRARKCAQCHVEIDHEIVAGGHPPLQFELVAYAQIMKHWDDQNKLPPGAFSVDPTIWAIGQVTGLRRTLSMIAERAGSTSYQALGKFPHFEGRDCYQCHHKLVDDAVRQATGHYLMVDAIFAASGRGSAGELGRLWGSVVAGAGSGADQARQAAQTLQGWLAPYEDRLKQQPFERDVTRQILQRITSSADRLRPVKRFRFERSAHANTVDIDNIGSPWWWTTGAPEQTVLAVLALCPPAAGDKCKGAQADIKQLSNAVDRFDYRPEQFTQSLGAVGAKLLH